MLVLLGGIGVGWIRAPKDIQVLIPGPVSMLPYTAKGTLQI